MALSRSTRLIAAWMVVGASVTGPRTEAASPPTDCVRTTIGPVVVDVPSVRIRPSFRLDGKPFPGAQAGSAVITLWASEPSPLFDGPQLSLGQTDEPPKSVRVVPGVYDVYYSWESGSRIPRNKLTRILQRVSLQQDGELVVDVPMVRIAGFKLPQRRAVRRRRQHRQAQPAARGRARRGAARRHRALAFRRPRDPRPLLAALRVGSGPHDPAKPARDRAAGALPGAGRRQRSSSTCRACRRTSCSSATAPRSRARRSSAGTWC